MKTVKQVLIMIVLPLAAFAAKLDLATHDSLIEKLESAVGADSSDSMLLQKNMAYRLADLYAERARLLSMDNEGQGDKIHGKQISTDRERAISILTKISDSLEASAKGSALLQRAHLHVMLNQNDEALKILKQIETHSDKYDAKSVAIVRIQLGDLAFQKSNFVEAKNQFSKAIQIKENPRQGYSQFRIAWINYNQGQTKLAEKQLVQLLSATHLFKSNSGTIDTSFQEEVSHDLALFMGMNDISNTSVKNLVELSPEPVRKKNLIFLASELDRTAKKQSALIVWKIVGQNETSFEEQLERQVQIARIEYDLGHKESLLTELDRAIILLLRPQCVKNAECTVANQNLRRIITDWAKAEERIPSMALISAFHKYTKSFDDYEMNYWAAQAAAKLKQNKLAIEFSMQAAQSLVGVKAKNEVQTKLFEGALLSAIENAELAKDPTLQLQVYQKYLELNPNGSKRSEVRYQMAHSFYEKNDYAQAAAEFRKLVLDSTMPKDLREKAADLTLDCLVIQKNESALEVESLEYSKVLPAKKTEYLNIYQKAILNQTAKVLNESKSKSALEKELAKLNSLTNTNFSLEEAKLLIKNKIELSYPLNNLDSLEKNAKALLAIKKISKDEKEMALRHLIWMAELKMNFKAAINYLAQIEPKANQREVYFLKYATLQELAQVDSTRSYENFISVSRDNGKKTFAAHQIVLRAKKPLKAFKNLESLLAKNSELYASAGIYCFEKTSDKNLLHQLLAKKSFRNSLNGQLLQHSIALQELKQDLQAINKNHLKGLSDGHLKKVLVQRTAQLEALNRLSNKAIKNKDTSLQLIYLAQVMIQNSRLADEILELPAPRQLSANDRKIYQQQVRAMVQPYIAQAQSVMVRTEQLWQEALAKNSLVSLTECLSDKSKPGCQIAQAEIATLKFSAQAVGVSFTAFEKLSEQRQKTLVESELLKEKIRANPFNMSDLAKMKTIQSSLGHGPMVAYLDQRLTELQTKRVQNAN